MDKQPSLSSRIEALLFAYGEPMSFERLATLTSTSSEEIDAALQELEEHYKSSERGLALLRATHTVQLVTNPQNADDISELLRAELSQDLGAAAVETLALVAYFGPVARSVIDHVRGVSSALSLRTLLVRGLIERTKQGKAEHMYQITEAFCRDMGIINREDLPDFEELSHLLERSLTTREAESPNKEV